MSNISTNIISWKLLKTLINDIIKKSDITFIFQITKEQKYIEKLYLF